MGDRRENILKAVEILKKDGIKVLKFSTIIETDPVGGPPQKKFLNAVIQARTKLSPWQLLKHAKWIEKELGRVRSIPNAPRPIDIDILLYNTHQIQTSLLIIPHPRMLERDFVMLPLKEIAPVLAEELTRARH
jgi:2-amino-4-hydroxy-6-hydroxymethyldihydropteridine diphosphokinase